MDIKLSQGEIFNIKKSTGEIVLSVGNEPTDTVQEKLVSGTNIKTINGSSILGSGNLDTESVFVAEYGETTGTEMLAAIEGEKAVFCRVVYGDGGEKVSVIPLTYGNYTTDSSLIFVGFCTDSTKISCIYSLAENKWGEIVVSDIITKATEEEIDALFDEGGGGGSSSI